MAETWELAEQSRIGFHNLSESRAFNEQRRDVVGVDNCANEDLGVDGVGALGRDQGCLRRVSPAGSAIIDR